MPLFVFSSLIVLPFFVFVFVGGGALLCHLDALEAQDKRRMYAG
jgi:hypothetical protein